MNVQGWCVSAGWCRKHAGAEREKETRFALLQVVVRKFCQTLLVKRVYTLENIGREGDMLVMVAF